MCACVNIISLRLHYLVYIPDWHKSMAVYVHWLMYICIFWLRLSASEILNRSYSVIAEDTYFIIPLSHLQYAYTYQNSMHDERTEIFCACLKLSSFCLWFYVYRIASKE